MDLLPNRAEILGLLRSTGALRPGHAILSNGIHASEYLETALLMRDYRIGRLLTVALARHLRANPDIRPHLEELSIVAATTGGLPVAYGLCEVLCARQVYWAERHGRDREVRFRQFLPDPRGEKVLLVDDILRSGAVLDATRRLLIERGAQVLGLAVLVHQPMRETVDFGPLPLYTLIRLETEFFAPEDCPFCGAEMPLSAQAFTKTNES